MSGRWREWARQLKREALAVYLAGRDRRVAWYAKLLALAVAAYAFSPIDLIPDFVPLLGYVDDLVIVPLGILLVIRMVPPAIMAEHRARAAAMAERPVSRAAAAVIVLVWVAVLALSAWVGLGRLAAARPATGRAAVLTLPAGPLGPMSDGLPGPVASLEARPGFHLRRHAT